LKKGRKSWGVEQQPQGVAGVGVCQENREKHTKSKKKRTGKSEIERKDIGGGELKKKRKGGRENYHKESNEGPTIP